MKNHPRKLTEFVSRFILIVAVTTISFTLSYSPQGRDVLLGMISNSLTPQIFVEAQSYMNNPPVALNDNRTTPFNTPILITVLANDSDPDDNPIELLTTQSGPTNGVVSIQGNQLLYTPNDGFVGTDIFTYTIGDIPDTQFDQLTSTATVSVTVEPAMPPIAVMDRAQTLVGDPVIIRLVTNDTDSDGTIDNATILIFGDPAKGSVQVVGDGTVVYTPDQTITADTTDTFTYTVNDNDGLTSNVATVEIVISVPVIPEPTSEPPISSSQNIVQQPQPNRTPETNTPAPILTIRSGGEYSGYMMNFFVAGAFILTAVWVSVGSSQDIARRE